MNTLPGSSTAVATRHRISVSVVERANVAFSFTVHRSSSLCALNSACGCARSAQKVAEGDETSAGETSLASLLNAADSSLAMFERGRPGNTTAWRDHSIVVMKQ